MGHFVGNAQTWGYDDCTFLYCSCCNMGMECVPNSSLVENLFFRWGNQSLGREVIMVDCECSDFAKKEIH